MRRPAFQFYPADWRGNAKLRRCSEAARGAWIDVMCLMHDADEYGVLRWPLADIARAAGVAIKLLRELVAKDVLKGAEDGQVEYSWAPTHAGQTGEARVLLSSAAGPCWYSTRMVRDEHIRSKRGAATRFEAADEAPPKESPKPPIGEVIGGGIGDGSSSASSSSSSKQERKMPAVPDSSIDDESKAGTRKATKNEPPGCPPCPVEEIVAEYHRALPMLARVRAFPEQSRKMLRARWREDAERQTVGWWSGFFEYIRDDCPFLVGGKTDFQASLIWLVKPENFAKTFNGQYQERSAAQGDRGNCARRDSPMQRALASLGAPA